MLKRILVSISILALACTMSVAAHAAADAPRQLTVPAGDLLSALESLSRQADVRIVYQPQQLAGMKTQGFSGLLTTEEAVSKLLHGTQLQVHEDQSGSTMLIELPSQPAATTLAQISAPAGSDPQPERIRLAQAPVDNTAGPASPRTASDNSAPLQEITVTGTLIDRPGFTAPTPTTVVTGQDLSLLVGATSAADIATYMTQFTPGLGTYDTNGAQDEGSSHFNLRGLGQERTLTLVDGQRQTPSDLMEGLDVNRIPAGIIDRVEVVTGGASAAYGSDAVAGVVNIILRKDIQGLEGSLEGGETSYHDDRNWKATLNYGTHFDDDRGRFLIATEAADNAGAGNYGSRPWGNQDIGLIPNPAFTGATGQYPYVLLPNTRSSNTSTGGVITSGVLTGTGFLPGGVPTQFNSGVNSVACGCGSSGGDGAQIFPGEQINTPVSRQTLMSRLSYDFTPQLTGYVSVNYAHTDSSLHNLVPMGIGGGWSGITIQSDNAFLPASLRNAMTAAGESSFTMNRDTQDIPWWGLEGITHYWQTDAGLHGKFGQTGSWNARVSFGQFDRTEEYSNDTNLTNLSLALDAVTNPANGQIVCRSTLTSPNNGCVPIDIFGAGSISPQARAYIVNDYSHYFQIRQSVANVDVQDEPFSLWAGPVSVVAGGTYRNEAVMGEYDEQTTSGNNGIFSGGNPGRGTIRVVEGFGETVIPLLKDLPLAHELDLNGAVRATSYNTVGEATTWKVGLTDNLTDGLRLRATRSRDIRAPNFSDLAVNGAQNVTEIVYQGTSTQVSYYSQANSTLKPENADTYTAGIVYQSPTSGDLQVSLDYFNTKIDNAITYLSPQQVVDGCTQGNAGLCANIVRNSGGLPTIVYVGEFNVQSVKLSGADFDLAYVLPTSALFPSFPGKLVLKSSASYLFHNLQQSVDASAVENAGNNNPRLSANASLIWSNRNLTVSVTGQYIGSECFICALPPGEQPQFAGSPRGSAVGYLHGGFEYTLVDTQSVNLQLFGNVNNLLNRAPPVIPYPTNGYWTQETDFAQYDTIGRRFLLGVRAKL
ncbi:MAG TPA: TonB-dependent receptor [Xanthobacteraceae bacterium]|jgi:outer membrane receptor protein involved in Fe transport